MAVLLAAVPVLFGFVRAINTGDDFRYLWLAASAIAGSLAVMVSGYRAPGPARPVSPSACVGRDRSRSRPCRCDGYPPGGNCGSGSGDSRGRVRALHWDKHGSRHRRTPPLTRLCSRPSAKTAGTQVVSRPTTACSRRAAGAILPPRLKQRGGVRGRRGGGTVRRVRYGVGMSLDGFIADRLDGTSWIIRQPGYDSRPCGSRPSILCS